MYNDHYFGSNDTFNGYTHIGVDVEITAGFGQLLDHIKVTPGRS